MLDHAAQHLAAAHEPPLLEGRALSYPSDRLDSAHHDFGLKRIACLLRRRKWTVIVFALSVLGLAAILTFITTPVYDAVGRISVARENLDSAGLNTSANSGMGEIPEYSMYLDAQVSVLQSDTLIIQVARNLHWLPEQDRPQVSGNSLAPEQRREDLTIKHLKSRLRVTRVARTPVIEIRFSGENPRDTAAFVNGLIHAYVDQNFKAKYESVMQVSNWLTTQLQELKSQVEHSHEDMVLYERQQGIVGLDDKQNIVTTKLDELNRELTAAMTDRVHKQAIYEAARSGDPELLPATSENLVVQHLKQQKSEIDSQFAQATAQLGPAHPRVIELKSQQEQINSDLRREIDKIAERAKSEYSIALTREQLLTAALNLQKQQANQLNESAIEYNALKHDFQSNQSLYDQLSQTLKQAGVTAGLKANNVTIVDYARVPTIPSRPNIPVNLAVGLFLGCIGGIVVAAAHDNWTSRLYTPDEFLKASALHPIAAVPELSESDIRHSLTGMSELSPLTSQPDLPPSVELITYANPTSPLAESYRALRTSLLLSTASSDSKVILVTSALPKEGKTTTAVNCAMVLAQRGARVLLIDADLRAPKIHRVFHLSSKRPGLSTLLSTPKATVPSDAIIQSAQLPSFFVLPAGPPPELAGELLSSPQMKTLVALWRTEFDHVVIDTAPVLVATESVMLTDTADSVLLTVRSGVTPKDALIRARDLLTDVKANLIGIVVNAINVRDPGFGYAAYSYSYKTH